MRCRDFFGTLGIPVKEGRDFTDADNMEASPHRFIVTEAFVRQYLRGEQPLGKKIKTSMKGNDPLGEIIGVVGDVREWSLERDQCQLPITPIPT